MYSEQLAILLLIAANSLSGQPAPGGIPDARAPMGSAERNSVRLKLDPHLRCDRIPGKRKAIPLRGVVQGDWLARAD